MKNYEDMSDIQLGVEVAERNGMEVVAVAQDGAIVTGMSSSFDINNPSHAWPIIFNNQINLTSKHGSNIWFADIVNDVDQIDEGVIIKVEERFSAFDGNPFRAAMICFLKMKESEGEVQ